MAQGKLARQSPIRDFVAAVSVGVVQGTPLLDLEYVEDVGLRHRHERRDDRRRRLRRGAGHGRRRALHARRDGRAAGAGRQGHPRTGGGAEARALGCWPDDGAAPGAGVEQRQEAGRAAGAAGGAGAANWWRRASSASPRPRSRTSPSSRTRWPRRATPRGRAAARRSPTTRACASTRWAARRAWSRRTTPARRAAAGDREARRRAQDAANNALLLQRLQGVADRRARFVSTLVARAPCRRPASRWSRWAAGRARSLRAPRGAGGFGYDPLMFIPDARPHAWPSSTPRRRTRTATARARRAQMLALMREVWRCLRTARRLRRPVARAAHYLRPGTLQLGALPPLSLYVHLPWCLKKCPYCDFNSPRVPRATLPERATSTRWCADLEAALPLVWGRRVHQRLHRRRHAQPVLARGHRPPARPTSAPACRWSPAARSRWRPTRAPSSANASAPSAPPA